MMEITRRAFFGRSATGLGTAALASLMGRPAVAATGGLPGLPHFAPRAKRVIYLFQSGGPSQMELFDYKPRLVEFQGTDLPASIRMGQRLTNMSSAQLSFPVVPSKFSFARHGQSGAWVSELMPHTAKIADHLTFIKSVYTEAINHDPAVTFLQTGSQIAGRPSMGSWVVYGLGSEAENLPAFVVMISPGGGGGGQPLYDRLWARVSAVAASGRKLERATRCTSNPAGFSQQRASIWTRWASSIGSLEGVPAIRDGDADRAIRDGVPDGRRCRNWWIWGRSARRSKLRAGRTQAGKCALQLFDGAAPRARGSVHSAITGLGSPRRPTEGPAELCKETDQPTAAPDFDLRQRGMPDDTLVV